MFDRYILDKGNHQATYDGYENKIDAVYSEINEDLFNNQIVPFCKKWNLSFKSGMGTFIFINQNGIHIEYTEERVRRHPNAMFFPRKFFEIVQFILDTNQLTKFCGCGYEYSIGKLNWKCKYCGTNEKPKCHKCIRNDGKIVSDELN